MLTRASLLRGIDQTALLLLRVSERAQTVRAWAFWEVGVVGVQWIGPRHTNFPDGSICAYDPSAGVWQFGDSLVELLDLYTVWTLRHLHLETFGLWPGPQMAHLLYERVLEFQNGELCGCGSSGLTYAQCCKEADQAHRTVNDAFKFLTFSRWQQRQPPKSILDFMISRADLPVLD